MIMDDIADLFTELHKYKNASELAQSFDRDRKWVLHMKAGASFVLDTDVVAGLKEYGYELKLVRIRDR